MSFTILTIVNSQEMPAFVQQRLDSLNNKAQTCLTIYRYGYSPYSPDGDLPNQLRYSFLEEEGILLDSLGLELNIGMIYDNEMRDRLVQLIRNEYSECELDTLVNRYINRELSSFERRAMEMCRVDTFSIVVKKTDSLFVLLETQNTLDMFKKRNKIYHYEAFKSLKLDTTTIFIQTYNKVVYQARERERKEWLTKTYYDYTYLAELCGYIGDERFVKPLIEVLEKPDNFRKEKVLEALARMRVEPYYSDYVKKRMLTNDQIMNEEKWLDFRIEDFVYVLGTQEAFLELSKYLLSNKPNTTEVTDYADHAEYRDFPVSQDAYFLIQDNIINEDIQKIMGPYREDIDVLFKPIYDWMQKNYGKYKIRRIW